jgi:DNA polymerase-3 subunit gamma/tau
VVFVFATTEPQKIAATAAPVLSRLQRFDFRRIGPAAIRERLRQVLEAEGIAADEDALLLIARQADGGMRDALSVLDQCLSFGEGRVTAVRVREILGVADDELYTELLGLVADQRPAGVFPLVERLCEAGADLVEFMGGAGEALRALLMLQLGGEPEGLTESVRQALHQFRDRLQPGDALRMLKLLTESEASIRRSGNPRLVVETLLLRWTMMDRTVDLQQVLGSAPAPAPRPPAPPAGRAPNTSSAPAPGPTPPAPVMAAPAVPPGTGITGVRAEVAALREAWPEIVAEVQGASRFLGEALAATTPAALEGQALTVTLVEPNPLFAERLQAQAASVEGVLQRATGQALRLRVTEAAPPAGGEPLRPRRLTDESLKADRLRIFRAKDAALDTAADALDLEIVD